MSDTDVKPRPRRAPDLPPVTLTDGIGLVPERYVRPVLFWLLTGISKKAVERKIQRGAWLEGKEFIYDPDGLVLVDREGYKRWAEGRRRGA